MPMCDHNFTVCSRMRVELRTDENAFRPLLAFSGGALRPLLSCYALFRTFLAPFLTGTADASIYFATFFFFFFFVCSFLHRRTDPALAVYLRSANAYNGCTKVTELAGVQRTTWVRVGLRGRALQTIAGLRNNVIVFFFKRTNERKKCAMIS
jgi:hypothetical protein